MDETNAPTLEALARLLETAGGGKHDDGVAATARWLIEESDAGRRLYAELVAREHDRPSLLDLARVECAVASDRGLPEALATARWLIAQSAPARRHLETLEQMAADADAEGRSWAGLLSLQSQLYQLVSPPDDWRDPNDVLDPTRSFGCSFTQLSNLCRARSEGSEGEHRRRYQTILEKLKRPAQLERLLPHFKRRIERLKARLAEARDPEGTAESLEEMARLLRLARETEGRE